MDALMVTLLHYQKEIKFKSLILLPQIQSSRSGIKSSRAIGLLPLVVISS